ncbi:MAG: hypothetical protein J6S00_07750, partial [Clostridia bacterium]|nr:hypothetical protein [Clostridia bacterium]
VETSTLAELQSVVLFYKDGTKSRNDLRVSVLENYISICKRYENHFVLELKSDFTEDEISKIVDIINGLGYLDNVTFIAFNYQNLVKVRAIYPAASAQFLFMEITDEIIERLTADKIDVDVQYKALSKEMIDKLHSLGIKVNCWTVDDKETAEQLCEWGVDYITSNILE